MRKLADDAARLFEIAIDRPVIRSLPSQVHRAMKAWIERNQLLKLSDEYGVKFCKWFVCNGEYDSVNLFISSLNCYENQMTHIFVRNFGLCDEWSQVESYSTRQKLLKKYQVKVIDFLSLGYKERYLINKKRLNFALCERVPRFYYSGQTTGSKFSALVDAG